MGVLTVRYCIDQQPLPLFVIMLSQLCLEVVMQQNATSFTSTLSGTADPALNGTLVECFGPNNNVEPENKIDEGTLQILGKYCGILSQYIKMALENA